LPIPKKLQHPAQNFHERLRQQNLEDQRYGVGTGIGNGRQVGLGLAVGSGAGVDALSKRDTA